MRRMREVRLLRVIGALVWMHFGRWKFCDQNVEAFHSSNASTVVCGKVVQDPSHLGPHSDCYYLHIEWEQQQMDLAGYGHTVWVVVLVPHIAVAGDAGDAGDTGAGGHIQEGCHMTGWSAANQ